MQFMGLSGICLVLPKKTVSWLRMGMSSCRKLKIVFLDGDLLLSLINLAGEIQRSYSISLPHNKIPDALCCLAKRLAKPAMLPGEEFQAEAAIVNYFAQEDTLGGHLDDMEKDWSKPIVSISLGCKAIFLLGGKSREDPPLAMFLRSGDAVLMAGGARECFHGVPRVFTDQQNAEIASLESPFSTEDDLPFWDYIRSSRININIRQVN